RVLHNQTDHVEPAEPNGVSRREVARDDDGGFQDRVERLVSPVGGVAEDPAESDALVQRGSARGDHARSSTGAGSICRRNLDHNTLSRTSPPDMTLSNSDA